MKQLFYSRLLDMRLVIANSALRRALGGYLPSLITHPLIFEWFYWLLYVTWCKSPDSYHAIAPARVDICPPIVSVDEKHSKRKNFNFSFLLFNMEGNQTNVIESSDSNIKKLMASAVP